MAFLLFLNGDFFYFVTSFYLVYDIDSLYYSPKTGMVPVEVLGIFPVVTDKELGSSRISASVRHRQYTFVMVLVVSSKFTINFVSWTTCSVPLRAATLNDEIRNDAMKSKSIVKAFLGKLNKVVHGVGGVLFIKFHFHDAFRCMYFCCFHKMFFTKIAII